MRPEEIDPALWSTMVDRLRQRADREALVPWKHDGLAHLSPSHLGLKVESIWLEPGMSHSDSDLIRPVHRSGDHAVYEIDGTFHVARDGSAWSQAYQTEDRELAELLCERWSREFPASALPKEEAG